MNKRLYYTGEVARMAGVTVRTVRFYDREGLLSPSAHSEKGYRLYTDEDVLQLQKILALKYLGFSLDEIKRCLQIGPYELGEWLLLQKIMLREKRMQLDSILQAIEETEQMLRAGAGDWHTLLHIIQMMQQEQAGDWRRKYLDEWQIKRLEELSRTHYTEAQRQKLAEWGKDFGEEEQKQASLRWERIGGELRRMVREGIAPASPEAQQLVAEWLDLIQGFTHGDPDIIESLKRMYTDIKQTSPEQRPFQLPYEGEEEAFLYRALALYEQRR
uniref:MerR family transcriptional regulator n=1 Tax=Thermosporothrix sp. COM3 TaxID=2490863 RepID=A0A455SE68_9CHLR|nr:MerR family transcriptional regulator [Thermosporothrix sp. COM3]